MTIQINFLAGQSQVQNMEGSGLGFYGANGFGNSISVGGWNAHTFITDGAGVNMGPEACNIIYSSPGSGILGNSGSPIALTSMPNVQATINIRVTSDIAVQVLNAEARIFDRNNPDNPASGVTTMVAQLIHPDTVQNNNGSGDTTWWEPGGSGVVVPLCPCPGPSGQYAGNGSNSTWTDYQHDWYLALSASPDVIGSQTQYGLWVSSEYL